MKLRSRIKFFEKKLYPRSELIKDTTIQYICELGGGKGKYTRYYFLQGLAKILTYQAVEQFVENQGISDDEFQQMKNVLLY